MRYAKSHIQIIVIIDTSEQGYNAAISSWRDMQNHTHIDLARRSSILLAGHQSCCMWSSNKLHLCWWLGLQNHTRAVAVRRRRDGWATSGVCLCARRPRVRFTTRLGAFWVNRCCLRHWCATISAQAPAAAAAWKKDGFEFLCFAAKTVGCEAKWWSSHRE
jgi:hypothetical protein